MLITTRDEIAARVEKQRAFGIDKGVITDRRHTGAYDIEFFGLNYRLGEVQAAIGVEQMKRLAGFLEARERNFEDLAEGLSRVGGIRVLESGHEGERRSSHYCLVAMLEPPLDGMREQIIDELKARGVGTSVYYPRSLPDTAYYAGDREGENGCPVARRISSTSIAFPVGPHVSSKGVKAMVSITEEVLAGVGAHA